MLTLFIANNKPSRLQHVLVGILSWLLLVQPVFVLAAGASDAAALVGGGAHAPGSIQRPYVDAAKDTVPVVNINTPNGSGLSHNTYEHFNVGRQGLILNNHATNVLTQQAGWVEGNPNLRPGQAASLILNEVVGASRSQLNGYTEVAGQKADVIVANPNGITCNGCGFINTDRATLTTGVPNISADGQLDHFRVEQGDILIEGDGLDARHHQQLDVVGRAVKVNAAVQAQHLNVIAGSNQVDYKTGETTALTGQGDAPTVAVDVASMGGMYANHIKLVATEAGVGVNMSGETRAAGDLSLDVNGNLNFDGVVQGNTALSATAESVTATQQANVQSQGTVAVQGKNQVVINEQARFKGQQLSISSELGAVENQGQLEATDTLHLEAGTTLTHQGEALSGGQSTLQGNTVNLAGTVRAGGAIQVSAQDQGLLNSQAVLHGEDVSVVISAGNLTQAGAIQSAGTLLLQAANDLMFTGSSVSAQDVTLNAQALTLNGTLETQAHANVQADTQATLQTGSTLKAESARVQVTAGSLTQSGVIETDKALSLQASTTLNHAGKSSSGAGSVLTANEVVISGDVQSSDTADIAADNTVTVTDSGKVTAKDIEITTSTGDIIQAGNVEADQQLTINAAGDFNYTNKSRSGGDTSITAQSLAISDMQLATEGNLSLTGRSGITLSNASLQSLGGDIALSSQQSVVLDGSNVSAVGNLTAEAQGYQVNNSTVSALGQIVLTGVGGSKANYFTPNSSHIVAAGGDLTLKAKLIAWDANSKALAGNNATIYTDTLTKQGGLLWAYSDLTIAGDEQGGRAAAVSNTAGDIVAYDGDLTIAANKVTNQGKAPTYVPDGYIATWSEMVTSEGETFEVKKTLMADVLNNDGVLGQLVAGGNISIDAETFDNIHANVSAGGDLTLKASTSLKNVAYGASQTLHEVHKQGCFTCHTGSLGYRETFGGLLEAGGNISASTNDFSSTVEATRNTSFNLPHLDEFHDLRASQAPTMKDFRVLLDVEAQHVTEAEREQEVAAQQDPLALLGIGGIASLAGTVESLLNLRLANSTKQVPEDVSAVRSLLSSGMAAFQRVIAPTTRSWRTAIETREPYTSYGAFLSSDYMMKRLAYSPEHEPRMNGEEWFKQRLLGAHYAALGNNKGFMSFGLTPAQARLQTVSTDPRTLKIKAGFGRRAGSTLLKGNNITIYSSGNIEVEGKNSAKQNLTLAADGDLNVTAALESGDDTTLVAGKDAHLTAVQSRSGGDTVIVAGNDLNVKSVEQTTRGIRGGQNAKLTNEGVFQPRSVSSTATHFTHTREVGSKLEAGGNLVMNAGNDVNVHASKTLADGQLAVKAGNNLNVEAGEDTQSLKRVTSTTTVVSGEPAVLHGDEDSSNSFDTTRPPPPLETVTTHKVDSTTDNRRQVASVLEGKDGVSLEAGNDINLTSSTIKTARDALLAAGQDINLLGGRNESRHKTDNSQSMNSRDVGSRVTVGENLAMISGNDINVRNASKASAEGQLTAQAGNDINVEAGENYQSHSYTTTETKRKWYGKKKTKTTNHFEEHLTHEASVLEGKEGVDLGAGNDINVVGSELKTAGDLSAEAGNAINLLATEDKHVVQHNEHTTKSWFGFKYGESQSSRDLRQTNASGSYAEAMGNMATTSGGSSRFQASDLIAGGNISIKAGDDVIIDTKAESSDEQYHESESGWTASLSGGNLFVGKQSEKHDSRTQGTDHQGSVIGSLGGNVSITADDDVKATNATIVASGETTIEGDSVELDSKASTIKHDESHEYKSTGLTIGVGGGVLDQATGLYQTAQAINDSRDDKTRQLLGIAAARDAFELGKNIQQSLSPGQGGMSTPTINISLGTSKSESKSGYEAETHTGNQISGETVSITARGDGDSPDSGNLSATATTVQANEVRLYANNELTLQSAQNTQSSYSENSSSSTSVGVSLTPVGGIAGVNASASNSEGHSNSQSTTHVETDIQGTKTVKLNSSGDTTLAGAVISNTPDSQGNTSGSVNVNVGGNLNIISQQDTASAEASQRSQGINGSIGGGSFNVSANQQQGEGRSDYNSVNEQSGIEAGDGGFDVTVQGNTDLQGGKISSTDAAEALGNNSLTTASLTHSNLNNSQSSAANTSGFSAGIGTGDGGKLLGNATPSLEQEHQDSDTSTTQATITTDNISVTDSTAQQSNEANGGNSLASLNRDNDGAHRTLDSPVDINDVLAEQQARAAAAARASQAVAKTVGDIATHYQNKAQTEAVAANLELENAQKSGDSQAIAAAEAKLAAANQQANLWKEGGTYRTALHTVGQGIVGELGAGQQAALGTLAGQLSIPVTAQLNESLGLDPKTSGNIVGQLLASSIGGLVGGSAGSFAASTTDRFNRQLHQTEYDLTEELAAREDIRNMLSDIEGYEVTEEELLGRIIREMNRNVDYVTGQIDGGVSDWNLRAVVGCGILQCNTGKDDPYYRDYYYNAELIEPNLGTFSAGLAYRGMGLTRDGFVQSNIENNPKSSAAAGIMMLGIGYVSGGRTLPLSERLIVGGVSGGTNATAQYIQNGEINDWTSLTMSALGGFTGAGSSLFPTMVNSSGTALLTAQINGQNPNDSVRNAAIGSFVGYGTGKVIAGKVDRYQQGTVPKDGMKHPDFIPARGGYGISAPNYNRSIAPGLGTVVGIGASQTVSDNIPSSED